MSEHPHVALLRRAYMAFAEPAADGLPDGFAEDVVWHVPGRSPIAGNYRGIHEIRALLDRLRDLSDGTAFREVHDVLANDHHGVALVRSGAIRNGERFFTVQVDVFPFRDGVVTEFWTNSMDQHAEDAFWSR
ncbi:MAG TPA: nuclear transport factor 2 family protein [Acidimicrobiales bacterium]|nr:nuclear transport factor 2 family protein [Acidimicrobiales bacterium]